MNNRLFIPIVCLLAMIFAVAHAQVPSTSRAGNEALGLGILVGKWVRLEGGYVINIHAVQSDGKLDAAYANPKPLPFSMAEATREGDALKLFFELRAGGYGGSTYTLNYDASSDTLRGIYNQVVVKQKFDVVFARVK
ncbi:hypothetical protein [Bradyrhizobium cosmicum]|uniref:hypothetical protein n=1 Tax=Bradyrhizobium cosmicum TaxID=1404864 RepID=UPI0028E8CF4B|nr:hypothetical protein [Bradyrhizobium cosmicum]